MGNSDILNEEEIFLEENFASEMNENVNVKRPANALVLKRIGELKLERVLSRKVKSPIAGQSVLMEGNKPRNSIKLNKKIKKDLIWAHGEKEQYAPFLEVSKNKMLFIFYGVFFFFKVDLYTRDFSTNYLQICIWSTNNPEDYVNNSDDLDKGTEKEKNGENKINIKFIDLKLIGETCLGFNKLFRDDFHAVK